MKPPENRAMGDSRVLPAWLEVVQKNVESLRFGVVQVIVHDGHKIAFGLTVCPRRSGPSALWMRGCGRNCVIGCDGCTTRFT